MNGLLVLHPGQTVSLNGLSPSALAAALRTHLPAFWESTDAFLIVENGPDRFLQLWAVGPDAFLIEHAHEDAPLAHPDGERTLDETVAIFERFAGGVWPPFEDGEPVYVSGETPSYDRAFSLGNSLRLFLVLLSLVVLAWLFFYA